MSDLPKPTDDIRKWLRVYGNNGRQVIAELDALEAENDAVTAERDALLRRIGRALRGIESGSLQRTKIALTEIEHGWNDAAKGGRAQMTGHTLCRKCNRFHWMYGPCPDHLENAEQQP